MKTDAVAPCDYWKSEEFRSSLERFVKRVVEKHRPEKVILFGSFARRDVHELSDVDVCIVAELEGGARVAER